MAEAISLTALAHRLISEVLQPGDTAIDATVGNGHDTLFLARRVGETGHVYGFDVQQASLSTTNRRLMEQGVSAQTELFKAGHERMSEMIPKELHGRIRAIMFNLGYLPRSDKRITTIAATTLQALQSATELLAVGGRISIVAYTKHPGGEKEWLAVQGWANALSPLYFRAQFFQGSDDPGSPRLILIDCLDGSGGMEAF